MLETVMTPTKTETFERYFQGIGFVYCVVDKEHKSIGMFQDFHCAVEMAGKWANYYPNEAPFSIEKREKLWFSDRM